jgi:translation initiation factor 1
VSKKGAWTDAGEADQAKSPFAALAGLRETLPQGSAGVPAAAGTRVKGPARAVVRLERKGRGGKDATIIAELGLASGELAVWLKALKAQLGCGGAVEGDKLALQGDLRKRVGPLLEARGVRKVING